MKLSDVKGERALDVMSEIVEPIANIAKDPAAYELFVRKTPPEGTNVREYVVNRITAGVPALLRDHKADVVAIVAAVNEKDPAEYLEKLNLPTLMLDIASLINDEVFCAFFTFAQSSQT